MPDMEVFQNLPSSCSRSLADVVALLEGLVETLVAAGADDLEGKGYSRPSSKSLSVTDWAWLGFSTVFSVSLEEVLLF